MEALDLHRTETAKLSEHQENCRLLGKHVRLLNCLVNTGLLVELPLAEEYAQQFFISQTSVLRFASQRKMIVPRYRLDSYGRRCFAVVDPST